MEKEDEVKNSSFEMIFQYLVVDELPRELMADKRLKIFVFIVKLSHSQFPASQKGKAAMRCVFTYVSVILIGFGPLVFPNITNLCLNTFYV